MPAIGDDIYCPEQISIPPSFPYLLRQYAKAAIRTQPIDLLKWSSAYFRCLSLNIPPPVKPRLEYPIPRDFHGITPGWLKALMYQLHNNQTISFKILWDRWIGACLEHNTLVKILCLGGFEDPQAIPWLRFVAICAGTLSDDLTHTMILICEILTEEPEGGSAMIPLETFLDLYQFLAKIDASKDQVIKNFWFRDSLLSLWREKVEKEEIEEEIQEEYVAESEQSEATKTSTESVRVEDEEGEMEKVVSCPSLPEDDQYSLNLLLKDEPQEDEEMEGGEAEGMGEEEEEDVKGEEDGQSEKLEGDEGVEEEKEKEEETDVAAAMQQEEKQARAEMIDEFAAKPEELADQSQVVKKEDTTTDKDSVGPDLNVSKSPTERSLDMGTHVRDIYHVFDDVDETLKEDLERLKALQQEMAGETDDELEKFKCRLIQEMPLTQSQEQGIKHFEDTEDLSNVNKINLIDEEKIRDGEASSESQEGEGDKRPYDEIFCEACIGIGDIVPDKIIQAVEEYMKKCAKIQHRMVMPRNIRHYSCPPLEPMDY